MKKIFPLLFILFILTACDTWDVPVQPLPVGTLAATRTPKIVTATPIIATLPFTVTIVPGVTVLAPVTITGTTPPSLTPTPTPVTPTETLTPTPVQSVAVDILGCNTGLDITHGMGEVTNAYVTVKNTGTIDLPNTCSKLAAIDEGREHPDKKKCVNNLPVKTQITLKLTVDSTYKQNTLIQVDTTSNDVLLLRVDKMSCADISLFGGEPSDVGAIKPIQQ
jgi:hypothetical protein